MDIDDIKNISSTSDELVTIATTTTSAEIRSAAIDHMSQNLLSDYFDGLAAMLPELEKQYKPLDHNPLRAKCHVLAAKLAN